MDGVGGVWLWFGAPIMHRMLGQSFARHWDVGVAIWYGRSHSNVVEFDGLL